MGHRLELRDLRSLERRSMYSIFHPLDADERLPRELILEGRRYRLIELRTLEIAGVLYLPALILAIVLMGSVHLDPLVAFAVAGLAFTAFLAYALFARHR